MPAIDYDYKYRININKTRMARLIELVKTFDLPREWRTIYAQSSIWFCAPDKKVTKIDVAFVVTLETTLNGQPKSYTFAHPTLEAAWKQVEVTLKAQIIRHRIQ